MATVVQRTQAWLAVAKPSEIEAARRRGELVALMGGTPAVVAPAKDSGEVLTEADLAAMDAAEILKALRAGQLDHMLRPASTD